MHQNKLKIIIHAISCNATLYGHSIQQVFGHELKQQNNTIVVIKNGVQVIIQVIPANKIVAKKTNFK